MAKSARVKIALIQKTKGFKTRKYLKQENTEMHDVSVYTSPQTFRFKAGKEKH